MEYSSLVLNFCKQILKYCFVILAGILTGFFLLVIVYALPVEKMKEHASQSIEMLTREGDHPQWADKMEFTQSAQSGDAIMIKTAVIDTDRSLIDKALLLPYIRSQPQVASVIDTIGTGKVTNYGTYARYWRVFNRSETIADVL